MLENAERAKDVLELLKTLDNHIENVLGNPQIAKVTVEGKAHLRLSWCHKGNLTHSQMMPSDTGRKKIRLKSTMNAFGYFRHFRIDTLELWKSLHSVRKRKRYRAHGIFHAEEFDDRPIETMYDTVENCLKHQIFSHSPPTLQDFIDERSGMITGPRHTVHRISLEESDIVARCLNDLLLPTVKSLWDNSGIVRWGPSSMVIQELTKWRQKAREGEALHRLASFNSAATYSSSVVVPRGSRVMDIRVWSSLSRSLADLGSKDPVQSGNMALHRYVCHWAQRKAFDAAEADKIFGKLLKGLTLILDLGASSLASLGLSINLAAFQSPRSQPNVESFYMLSCD